jgi:Zn-finger nucleic acid-binding protein
MRSYERSGITLEQCTECRGIFLDRGELERLSQAEAAFHGVPAAQSNQPPQSHQPHQSHQPQPSHGSYPQQQYPPQGYSSHDSYSYGGHQYKKKKKHFLEELFD